MRRQTKRSHDVRSFGFCRHLCTVLSPATSHRSDVTRLLTDERDQPSGGRKVDPSSMKKQGELRSAPSEQGDYVSDRSQVREHLSLCYFCTTTSLTGSSCSYLAVTLLSLRDISPVRGIAVWGAKPKVLKTLIYKGFWTFFFLSWFWETYNI